MNVSELKSIYDNKFLIFDLDNTIYDEKIFLFKVYKEISELFDSNCKEIYHYLVNDFLINDRKKLFNRLLERYSNQNISIKDCLSTMRNHKNKNSLKPFNWFISFCNLLKDYDEIKIITNGNSQQQRNKTGSLNLYGKKVTLNVVCANDYKPKPSYESLRAFKDMPENRTDIYYLGDSQIDYEFCKNAKINFINVNQLL